MANACLSAVRASLTFEDRNALLPARKISSVHNYYSLYKIAEYSALVYEKL